MPPNYGEGKRAFRRLQEEIFWRIPDNSIFAWQVYPEHWLIEPRPLFEHATIPPIPYMHLLDTTTGCFVDHRRDRAVPCAVFSFVCGPDEMKHGALMLIQRHSAAAVLRGVLLDWSLFLRLLFGELFLLLLFLLFPFTIPLEYAYCGVCDALWRGLVNRFERWGWLLVPPDGSILNDPRLTPTIFHECTLASRYGHRMLWKDSSCFNRENTPQLREVLDSYTWSHNAKLYVYLADVPKLDDPQAPASAFRQSPWFRQCWTLPDLVAPQEIIFFSQEWEIIGTKTELAHLIEDITGIDHNVLTHNKSIHEVSVAERLSWAMNRDAVHAEDRAYCLCRLFDITMTYQYGEGGEQALRRLITRVLRRNPNDDSLDTLDSSGRALPVIHTILAERPTQQHIQELLAPSPSAFAMSGNIRPMPRP